MLESTTINTRIPLFRYIKCIIKEHSRRDYTVIRIEKLLHLLTRQSLYYLIFFLFSFFKNGLNIGADKVSPQASVLLSRTRKYLVKVPGMMERLGGRWEEPGSGPAS